MNLRLLATSVNYDSIGCLFKWTRDESLANNNIKESEMKELEFNQKLNNSQKFCYSLILNKKIVKIKLVGELGALLFKQNSEALNHKTSYLRCDK